MAGHDGARSSSRSPGEGQGSCPRPRAEQVPFNRDASTAAVRRRDFCHDGVRTSCLAGSKLGSTRRAQTWDTGGRRSAGRLRLRVRGPRSLVPSRTLPATPPPANKCGLHTAWLKLIFENLGVFLRLHLAGSSAMTTSAPSACRSSSCPSSARGRAGVAAGSRGRPTHQAGEGRRVGGTGRSKAARVVLATLGRRRLRQSGVPRDSPMRHPSRVDERRGWSRASVARRSGRFSAPVRLRRRFRRPPPDCSAWMNDMHEITEGTVHQTIPRNPG